jgi:hypothetical protein
MSWKMLIFARFIRISGQKMAAEHYSFIYTAYKAYIRVMVNVLYYKDVQILGMDNVPAAGTPLLIVSDHQNSLNDALGIFLSMDDRKVHFMARADVFDINPLFSKFLYDVVGLLPAFRIAYEGEAALHGNDNTFKVSEQRLLDGKTVAMYPEAGHQDHHWLGRFTYGYTRLAFEAAQAGGFEKEIFILPSCNHYSKYRGLRNSMLIKYGTPVSLAPYYELYKTKPRTAQRQVNAIVREQISSMMLNIEDEQNYKAIDFLRDGEFGRKWASDHGYDPDNLPSKLESDKALVAAIASVKEDVQPVLDDTASLVSDMESARVVERDVADPPSRFEIFEEGLLLFLLLPIALFCLWPSVLAWGIPKHFSRKVGDVMLEGSFVLAIDILLVIPVCALITFVTTWIFFGFVRGIAYALLLPFLCLFEWEYYKMAEKFLQKTRYRKAARKGLTGSIEKKYKSIMSRMGEALSSCG